MVQYVVETDHYYSSNYYGTQPKHRVMGVYAIHYVIECWRYMFMR